MPLAEVTMVPLLATITEQLCDIWRMHASPHLCRLTLPNSPGSAAGKGGVRARSWKGRGRGWSPQEVLCRQGGERAGEENKVGFQGRGLSSER